ncbi:hypothetical protein SAMN04487819_10844 [Actinopolyspora alba]|uniref:Uncharacterized protein n=1 Tax=Actinopolyspora alba TaxID=673379 RepID=A0A1I1XY51_9ACTN|nr:hypothetical protein SAMN04487819_10844 [Actinopolyspora alba]
MVSGRFLRLYLRSRNVPAVAGGMVSLLVLSGWNGRWLGWTLPRVVLVFFVVLAAVLLAGSFATPSPELDAGAVVPWWRWHLGHALVGIAGCGVSLALAVFVHRHGTPGLDLAVLRDLLGFSGLALLTGALLGVRLSWTVPLAYALVAWVFSSVTAPWSRALLWPVLSPTAEVSWWAAIGLCGMGTTLIAVRGTTPEIRQ